MSRASEWRRDHEDQDRLSQNLTLLPEIFREHGYQTALPDHQPNVGSFFGFGQGWDSLQELYDRRDEGLVRSTELIHDFRYRHRSRHRLVRRGAATVFSW